MQRVFEIKKECAVRVQIVLFDGFDLLDAIAPYEVLWAGGEAAKGALTVEFASYEGPRAVPSGPSGLLIQASAAIDLEGADLILVPGAAGDLEGDGPNTIPAILGRAVESGLPEALEKALASPKITVATVCGGSLILGMAGLLQGRNAVTHHLGMEVLSATGANAITARVVDDGDLITGGGVTSGLDVAFYLLDRELGSEVALSVEKLFEYERRGTVWRRPNAATD
jgi:transcriptional regulator GlxA family with amidase domain